MLVFNHNKKEFRYPFTLKFLQMKNYIFISMNYINYRHYKYNDFFFFIFFEQSVSC